MSDDRLTPEQIWDKLEDQHVCMLVEQESGNALPVRARPMAPLARKDEGVIWFVTDRSSRKVGDLSDDDAALLLFQDGGFHAAIEGAAAIVDDRAKVHALWSPAMKNFFDGPDDPRIVLIGVTPHACEYWSGPGAAMTGLKMLFTAATGVKTDIGTQGA